MTTLAEARDVLEQLNERARMMECGARKWRRQDAARATQRMVEQLRGLLQIADAEMWEAFDPPARRKPSRPAGRDGSRPTSGDASRRARADGSRPPRGDASPEVLGDASASLEVRRVCSWCGDPIPDASKLGRTRRVDAQTCSKSCRQARHRFRVAPAAAATDRPRRFGYADPPYPGLAKRYYDCAEVDHAELVARLVVDFPDGWALSTSSDALQAVLAVCPAGVRVCVWLRPSRRVRARKPRRAFEVVILYGGRPLELGAADELDDVLAWGGRQASHPGALVGMKPAAFCEWMFRLLGARQGDDLVDLFPGSGAVGRAWALHVAPAGDATRRGGQLESRYAESRRRLDPSHVDEGDASATIEA